MSLTRHCLICGKSNPCAAHSEDEHGAELLRNNEVFEEHCRRKGIKAVPLGDILAALGPQP